jgi:hypothetical protein
MGRAGTLPGVRARRVISVALLAAAIAAGALAASGQTAKPRTPSTITIRAVDKGEDFFFRGRVRSEDPRCERRRRVEITAGNGFLEEPVVEGVVRTDGAGRYELQVKTAENSIGGYRAKALRKARRTYICTTARSEIVNP